MPVNTVAENVLGTIGAICWTVQLVPQIWKSWRTKSTEGLSDWFILMWSIGAVFLGVYAVVQDINVPLILQPQLFSALSLFSWAQCMYYGRKWSFKTCTVSFISLAATFGGFEAGMVYAVRPSYRRGDQGPVEAFGILSSAIISLALLPQYYEIYKHREVVGISVTFMTVDMLGGVFSDLSLAFKQKFDVIAAVTYSLVVVLDGIVIVLALILNPLAAKRRKRAALALTETDVRAEGSQAEVGRIVSASPNSRDSLGDRDLDVILEDRNTQLVLPKGDDGQEEKPHG